MKALPRLFTLLLLVLLSACAGTGGDKVRQSALSEYGAAIRWGEFDRAQEFVDPIHRAEHPITDLDRERFKLIQVSGYEVKHASATADGLQQTDDARVFLPFFCHHLAITRLIIAARKRDQQPFEDRYAENSSLHVTYPKRRAPCAAD